MTKIFNENNDLDIDLNNLHTGIYFVRLDAEDGVLNKKIILE